MIISFFYFSKEFKAVIYACKHEKSMAFAQKLIKAAILKTAWWREEGESIEGFIAWINYIVIHGLEKIKI